jgi:uncharacterized repeat protein (TIGR01451 family)
MNTRHRRTLSRRAISRAIRLLAGIAVAIPAASTRAGVPPSPPVLTKSFSPSAINPGESTVLTFTVENPALSPPFSNIGFIDTLPSGVVVASVPGVGGTCVNAAAATTANAGANNITVSNLQIQAGASVCTVTVNVTNAAGQTNASCSGFPAAFTNASGNVTVSNVVNDIQPSCLVVRTPTLTKSFSPSTIASGDTTVLTFTIANPAGSPALANVGFVDALPSGLAVADNTVGGTCANAAAATTATPGGSQINVSGLQLAAGDSTCTVTVNVTSVEGQTNGSCSALPSAFTNGAANLTVSNVANGVEPACLVVQPTEPSASGVPTLSIPMLALLAFGAAAAGLHLLRRFSG